MASLGGMGSLTLNLIARTAGFEQGVDRAARISEKRMKQIERSAKIAGAALGGALVGGMALVIRNSAAYERSIAQLDAIIKSTGQAAGYARGELEKMARSMSGQSTFATREIIEAQTRLLSYSGVLGENIPRAMQAIIDQSARLGMSVSQSAETIGRALESPSKAAAALAQQGFGAAFTEEVRKTIDALVAAGREGEAQVMILEILEESYGGAAKAARDTFGGALQALRNTLGDLMTGSHGSLDGATASVNSLISTLNDPNVQRGFQSIVNGALSATGALAGMIGKIGELGEAFRTTDSQSAEFLEKRLQGIRAEIKSIRDDPTGVWGIRELIGLDRESVIKDLEAQMAPIRAALMEHRRRMVQAAMDEADAWRPPAAMGNLPLPTPSPSGRKPIALPDFAKDAAADLRALLEMTERARERFDGLAATLEGPLAAANHRYKQDLAELNELAAVGSVASEDLAKAIERLTAKHEANVAAINARMSPAQRMLEDLKFERDLLRMTNEDREVAIALRWANVDALSAEGKELAGAVREMERYREETSDLIRAQDAVRDAGANFMTDFATGAKSFKDAMIDALDSIHQRITKMIAENLMDQLFGARGQDAGGSAGGWLSAIFSMFGGGGGTGFADGGYTGAGGKHQPAGIVHAGEYVVRSEAVRKIGLPLLESLNRMPGFAAGGFVDSNRQFDLAVATGRDYLRAPSARAMPSRGPGDRGGFQQNVNFNIEGKVDMRTQQQIAREMHRQGLKASMRS